MHYVYIDQTNEVLPRPFYVGQGNDSRVRRVKRNRKHSRVGRKYGIQREIVFSTSVSDLVLEIEKQLIAALHTYVDDAQASSIACNLTPGGERSEHASITREKIRSSVRKQWCDPLFRQERQRSMRGKLRSDETKQRLSIAGKGRKLSAETIAKRTASVLGSKRSPETRAKMSAARKEWWVRQNETK